MFTVEINDADITAALAAAVSHLSDLSPVMNAVGAMMRDQTEDRFAEHSAPDGTGWAARSPTTLALYARRATQPGGVKTWGGLLHYSGQMAGNIHHSFGPDFAEVGSPEPYAAAMQFGAVKGALGAYWYTSKTGKTVEGSSPWGNIPARPFLGLSDANRTDILDLISDALAAALTS